MQQNLDQDIKVSVNTMNECYSVYPNEAYHIGWITALPLELAAAKGMLDKEHGAPQNLPRKTDNNTYALGSIGHHNVVIACLPRAEVGSPSAALVANDMLSTFPSIRIGLMVGIGAGIPDCGDGGLDIRLGDVVISSEKKKGGVVAYNFGKRNADGSIETAYHLNQPPRVLCTALTNLEAAHELRDNKILEYIDRFLVNISGRMREEWAYPVRIRPVAALISPAAILSAGRELARDLRARDRASSAVE